MVHMKSLFAFHLQKIELIAFEMSTNKYLRNIPFTLCSLPAIVGSIQKRFVSYIRLSNINWEPCVNIAECGSPDIQLSVGA